jgi:hydroxyacylglutathione hydrolase
MMLEDHLGDIIRKARRATNISAEAAAKAAGLSAAELEQLEDSGKPPRPLNHAALAPLLGLNAAKLERLASGWLPDAPDLGTWRELRRITTTQRGNTVNCYLVWDEISREGALFDTGWEAAPIFEILDREGVHLQHLFLTHTHEDHVAAMGDIRARFPKIRLHTNAKSAPPQHRNRSNDFLHLNNLRISNRDTPGHAEDGVTYIIGSWPEDAPNVAIVGDAVFAGSMGTGFQSWDLAKEKIREQLLTLPTDTLVCPGHGPFTTIGEEKENNPFF